MTWGRRCLEASHQEPANQLVLYQEASLPQSSAKCVPTMASQSQPVPHLAAPLTSLTFGSSPPATDISPKQVDAVSERRVYACSSARRRFTQDLNADIVTETGCPLTCG